MMIETYIEKIISLIQIGILLFLWLFIYPRYRINEFRQRIFELRDVLFNLGVENRDLFSKPAYKMLRNVMNGSLRLAESYSLWHALLFILLERIGVIQKLTVDFSEEFQQRTKEIDDTLLQQRLREIHTKYIFEVIRYTFVKSLPLFVITFIFDTFFKFIHQIREFKSTFVLHLSNRSETRTIENQSYRYGLV